MEKNIYPFTNIWIDWSGLSYIFDIRSNDETTYSLKRSLDNSKKLIKYFKDKTSKEARFIIGFQFLESNKCTRQAMIKEISQIAPFSYNKLPEKVGFEALHWLYMVIEIQMRLIAYYNGFPVENGMWKQFIQQVMFNSESELIIPLLDTMNQESYKFLGEQFKKIVEYHKEDYKRSKYSIYQIYKAERDAMYDFARNISKNNLPKITKFLFKGKNDEEISSVIESFMVSDYFTNIYTIDVYANLFAVMLSNKVNYAISDSERQDLIGVVEAVLYSDIAYIDKRILQLWKLRPDRTLDFEFKKVGELIEEFRN